MPCLFVDRLVSSRRVKDHMCFEKPPKKWLFETHVASQHKTHGADLHVGPVAVQRILRIPITIIVQMPTLTGTNIGLT